MNHDRMRRLLPAYADGQIGPVHRFLLGRHITTCPSCLAELEAMQALRSALRTNMTVHRAPPALAIRIGSALPREAQPPTRGRPIHFGFANAAVAGGCVGIALTLAVTRLTPPPDPLITDVVANHVRSLMAEHLTDVTTGDQHTVKPWLSRQLDLAPVVKDLAANGYPLVGGRLDYVEGHRAAAIVYQRDKHVINLFAFRSVERSDLPLRQDVHDGFNIVRWRSSGLSYVAVSDVSTPQLVAFARLVANS